MSDPDNTKELLATAARGLRDVFRLVQINPVVATLIELVLRQDMRIKELERRVDGLSERAAENGRVVRDDKY